MKRAFILTFVFGLILTSFNELQCQQESDEKELTKFLNEIIQKPARMFETMENSQVVNCTDLIFELKKTEWRLIVFTMELTRIKLLNYKYDGIDLYKTTDPNEDSIHYHYVINKGLDDEDMIVFQFYKKGERFTFRGNSKPID